MRRFLMQPTMCTRVTQVTKRVGYYFRSDRPSSRSLTQFREADQLCLRLLAGEPRGARCGARLALDDDGDNRDLF